jgi:hypothetical protein
VSPLAGAWPVTSEWLAEHFPALLIAMLVVFAVLFHRFRGGGKR